MRLRHLQPTFCCHARARPWPSCREPISPRIAKVYWLPGVTPICAVAVRGEMGSGHKARNDTRCFSRKPAQSKLSPPSGRRVCCRVSASPGLRLELGDSRARTTHRIGGRTQPRPDDAAAFERSKAHRSNGCTWRPPHRPSAKRDHPRHARVERPGRIQKTTHCEAGPLRTPVNAELRVARRRGQNRRPRLVNSIHSPRPLQSHALLQPVIDGWVGPQAQLCDDGCQHHHQAVEGEGRAEPEVRRQRSRQ